MLGRFLDRLSDERKLLIRQGPGGNILGALIVAALVEVQSDLAQLDVTDKDFTKKYLKLQSQHDVLNDLNNFFNEEFQPQFDGDNNE